MSKSARILLSIAILTIDIVVFFVPLTAFFLIYILWANPPWFRAFLSNLNTTKGNYIGQILIAVLIYIFLCLLKPEVIGLPHVLAANLLVSCSKLS